jgi:hypothetical protein
MQKEKEQGLTARERKIDECLEETFPASDAPSFVGAGAEPGGAIRKKRRGYGASPYFAIWH